ncbi:MAG TPA: lipoyl synthase [Candidatus Anoxymicrobiaceae bacterium]
MPRWLLRPVRCGPELAHVEGVLEEAQLNTVCVGAKCPNRGECYSAGTATFMIMGVRCTRGCGFCAVATGVCEPLDEGEPRRVAEAAIAMGLRHVVVTSVTRDDLPDGGAQHFASTVSAVRDALPGATVEVLVPDFGGRDGDIDTVIEAGPDVFNHNVETVGRLYREVRPQADYERSLTVLARSAGTGLATKSGFMVGLGETEDEVQGLLADLLGTGCRLMTAGQYLRPSKENLPVERYWEPAEFEALREKALSMGFEAVASGPLVRSSYFAHEMLDKRKAH